MAKVTVRLDVRRKLQSGEYPIKIAIARKGRTLYLPTGKAVKSSDWDKVTSKVLPLKNNYRINNELENMRQRVERKLSELQDKGEMRLYSDKKLLAYLAIEDEEEDKSLLFSTQADSFLSLKTNRRTREIYEATLNHIRKFCNYEGLLCSDITVQWLRRFESYLSVTSPSANARAIHLRNIRAIINHAIDNEVLDSYAFRRFKIRTEETEKRSLSIEQMRALLEADIKDTKRKYLDCFFLIFYLIGINIVDLSRVEKMEKGRIRYKRAKTGTLYNIKVEPEAREIIERYAGRKKLLRFFETNKDYRSFEKHLNDCITEIANDCGIPGRITTYFARHSWATIAASVDIPRDTISECLGHKYGSRITAVYVDFDQKKKDEANRKVIDYLFNKAEDEGADT